MDAGSHSLSGVLKDYAQLIPAEWLAGTLLLVSMTLQLVLVVFGAHRHHCSEAIFRFVVWGAYISADAVAISALGTMLHSCAWSRIYGIWAPVLLLHLGGPDAITAYSRADNELWLRHGFNMLYQVLVAAYVIYSSALEGHALASAILLLVTGATKYGERTLALWFASDSQIVKSCLPIAKYIKEKSVVQDRGYVIIGEKQVQRMIEEKLEASSREGRDIETGLEVPSPEGRDKEAGLEAASVKGRGIVTTKDVENANIERLDYNLCLSYALYKMYMRRFVSLYFEEGDWMDTRSFWVNLSGKEAFRIVQTELKFMYDALFSKGSGTAFSSSGIVLRLLNCVLMGAAGFLILRDREETEAQRMVTCIVISVALVVEVFQLCRIMVSDWTRVRLICAQVEEIAHPLSKVIKIAVLLLLKVQKVIRISMLVPGKVHNVVRGDGYMSNGIHQHCLIGTCFKRSRFVWNMTKFFPKADSYIASWHVHKVSVQEKLKDFIFDILKRKSSPNDDSETCRQGIYYFEEDLLEKESEIQSFMSSHENLEEVILVWHIATTLCSNRESSRMIENVNENVWHIAGRILESYRESSAIIENENVRWSIILSRYCAYLLVSRPRLLPVHPDMARITYTQLVGQLMRKDYLRYSVLGSGVELARNLLRIQEEKRWKLLAEYWGGLLIYMAVYNKATFHAECVAGGGEFLSQVWVLVGHMGYGEQSDSAVRKKIESSKEGDRRERRRIKRERLERERLEGERRQKRLEREHLERLGGLEQERLERLERERLKGPARKRVEWERLERLQRESESVERKQDHVLKEFEDQVRDPEQQQRLVQEWVCAEWEWEQVERDLDRVSRAFEELERE